jgi:hypothetical protein
MFSIRSMNLPAIVSSGCGQHGSFNPQKIADFPCNFGGFLPK